MISTNYILIFAAIAALTTVIFKPFTPISNGLKYPLEKNDYDIINAVAPTASGFLVEIFGYIVGKSRFGPWIVRLLLNDNRPEEIRELAAQIDLPPMYFPVRRYSAEERNHHVAEMEPDSLIKALQNGITRVPPDSSLHRNLKTIEDYASYYRQEKGKPSDIIRNTLQTIHEWEKEGFKIFSMIIYDAVMQQAYESDRRFAEGKSLSILDGVPIAVKDTLNVTGHTIYWGQSPLSQFDAFVRHAESDDILVRRFRELGAIIVGLTIMTEGGTTPGGFNSHFQGPVSPYSWNRFSGGSSAGSAVAVATGLVPVAIGFDSGGSVRLPSSMSGLHGLAASFAHCPFDYEIDSTLIKPGPIAASSADVAIAYAVMCRTELSHFYSKLYDGGVEGPPQAHLTNYEKIQDLSDVRIGIFPAYFNASDDHIRQRVYDAVAFLQGRGATIVPIKIPHLRASNLAHGLKILSEYAMAFDRAFHSNPSGLEPSTKISVAVGSTVTALEGLAGEKLRHYLFDYIVKLFANQRLTAIVTPTIGIDVPILFDEAKTVGDTDNTRSLILTRHVFLANFIGLPGYSVPVGFVAPKKLHSSEPKTLKLPVGLQLIGDHWQEHNLIRLAHAIEDGFASMLEEDDRAGDTLFQYRPF